MRLAYTAICQAASRPHSRGILTMPRNLLPLRRSLAPPRHPSRPSSSHASPLPACAPIVTRYPAWHCSLATPPHRDIGSLLLAISSRDVV